MRAGAAAAMCAVYFRQILSFTADTASTASDVGVINVAGGDLRAAIRLRAGARVSTVASTAQPLDARCYVAPGRGV